MKNRYLWVILFLFAISTSGFCKKNDEYKSYYQIKPKGIERYHAKDHNILKQNRYINWKKLEYVAQVFYRVNLKRGDDFISKPFIDKEKEISHFRQLIFSDLLLFPIDYELTLKRLEILSPEFEESLSDELYKPGIFNIIESGDEALKITYTFPLKGENGLIDLILKSQYYSEKKELKTIHSQYQPNYYSDLVIETRGTPFKVSLFPRIFSYDKQGKLILVYSLTYSKWDAIKNKGYVQYSLSEKNFLGNKHYYISSTAISGDGDNDIIISRNDYLKFFASHSSLVNLSRGGLVIITDNKSYLVEDNASKGTLE
jgi:hypothetical protein